MIKAYNLIHVKTRPRHPGSSGIVERCNGTVRDETNNDYGDDYWQVEGIIAKPLQRCYEDPP